MDKIAKGNSVLVTIDRITDAENRDVDGLVVDLTLLESDKRRVVSGMDWPVKMDDTSNGSYRTTLEPDLAITPGNMYVLKVVSEDRDARLEEYVYVVCVDRRRQ